MARINFPLRLSVAAGLLIHAVSMSAPLADVVPIHLKNHYYAVTRPCRFSPWTRKPLEFDFVMRSLHAVVMIEEDPTTQLPLVIVESNHQKIPGFLDRRCLDPGPLQDFEYKAFYQDQNPFEPLHLSPTLQGVIRSKADPRLLSFDPAPLTPKALEKIRQLQADPQKLSVDVDALVEVSLKESTASIAENLFAFLTTSTVDLGDLINFSSLEDTLDPARLERLSKIGGEALLMSFGEIRNSSKPSCSRIKSGVRLFFASGLKFTDPDQVLAAYGLLYGIQVQEKTACSAEIAEAQLLLDQLSLAKPASPYEEDQAWKRTWGIATDDTIARAFPGKKIRIIRDDGDLSSEKRVISNVSGWGTLEQYKASGRFEYRWIQRSNKRSAHSTVELKKQLKRYGG